MSPRSENVDPTVSATYDQRVFRWGRWHGIHDHPALTIVGYEHQCGAATLVDFDLGYDGTCCSGCRFEIQRPERECQPIYRPAETPPIGRHLEQDA